jgi:ribosomal protein S7
MPSKSRDRAAENVTRDHGKASTALRLMEQALELIDANDGPHDAGAILDHAIHRLRAHLEATRH